MIILDTCILIFDALAPEKLSEKAVKAIKKAEADKNLFCAGISLWEIGMLISKKRLNVDIEIKEFLELIVQSRNIEVLNITPEIAEISTTHPELKHGDPADRIIAATTIAHFGDLVTCDQKLLKLKNIKLIW